MGSINQKNCLNHGYLAYVSPSGLLSRRLSLFPPLLSGRVEELIAGVDWDYRYRCLQVFFLTAHLFSSPSVSLIRIIDHRSWLTYGYLKNVPSSCNILFRCMPLFLPSTAPIWTIDHWSWLRYRYLSDARTPPLCNSLLFRVRSTNSKNDGDLDVCMAYILPFRVSLPLFISFLHILLLLGWLKELIARVKSLN